MTAPVRIQRRRARGWRMPSTAVYVGRPTRWGNPFTVTEHSRAEAVAHCRVALLADAALLADVRRELAGRDLACWCPLTALCHADVLLQIANTDPTSPGGTP